MSKRRKRLSLLLTFIFTFTLLLNSMAAQAAQKQVIVPNVDYVKAPILEYSVGDIVTFDLHSPNYGRRVQYRVILWDDNKKEARDLWTTGDRYYTSWMPYGNNNFNLHFRIDEPGSYRITVYVKRAGLANNKTALKGQNCDSYMESKAFVVKAKTIVFDKDGQTHGSADEGKIEVWKNDVNIRAKDVTFSNAKIEGNLTITGDNSVIKNINVLGKLIIDPGRDGNCTLDNINAAAIEVLSGGQNSIHIRNSSAETMNVNSQNPVRIEVDGDTEIVSVTASGYVIFDRKNGTYGTITIIKGINDETVVEFRGSIQDRVEVETAATIRIGQDSSISNLVINTENNNDIVKLEGQYNNIEIISDAKLELGANTRVENIIANSDAQIRLDDTANIKNIEKKDNKVVVIGDDTPPIVGGGGGYVPPEVAVTSIAVEGAGNTSTVVNGGTLQMNAVVTPSNATNKSVIWSVTNGTGAATISSSGLLTGTKAGSVTAKALARDGSLIEGTKEIIVINGDQAAPTGLVGVAPATSANNDGKITGTTTAMEYKLASAGEGTYTACTNTETTGLAAGNYEIRYAVKPGYNASAAAAVTVPAYVSPKSAIATLSDLTVKGVTVTGFAPDKLTYNVELPAGTTVVPNVVSVVTDTGKATAVVNPAVSLPGATTIVVTAEDEITKKTYTINFTVAPNPVIISVTVEPSSVTVTKGDVQQLAATVVVAGGAAQTLNWTSSDITGKVTVDGTGLVTVSTDAETGNYTITATSTADSSKYSTSAINVIPPAMAGTAAITGSEKFGSTLTAVLSLINVGTPTYQWNRAGAPIPGATESTYTLVEADITKTITVTITADGIAGTGSITSTVTGVIGKADGPAAPAAPILASKTNTSITLTANSQHEFSMDNGITWQNNPVFTGLTELTPYTFAARVKATSTTNESTASDSITITTDAAVSVLTTPMATAPGLTIIKLSQVISGLVSSDINVMKNGIPLINSTDYNIAGLDSTNVTIVFLPQTALDRTCAVTVKILKPGYFINNGSPITIPNNIPIAAKSITVTSASDATIVPIGETLQMTASILPENADDKTIAWTVEPGTGAATIDSNGLLTGTVAGTVTVKATNAASGITGTKVIRIVTPAPALNQLTLLEGADQGNTQVVFASHTGAASYKYKLQTVPYSSLLYVGMAEPAGFSLLVTDNDIAAAAGQHLIVLALDGSGNVLAASDHILTGDEVRALPVAIYMADYNNNRVQACTSTNSDTQVLVPNVETNPYSGPMAITVSGGRIYWAEQDSRLIRSSALNGTDIRTVVAAISNNISAIAVDEANDKIYWADYSGNRICSTSLLGGPMTVVILNADNSTSTSYKGPFAMTISGQKLYWAGDVSGLIESADLDGTNRKTVVTTQAAPQSISSIAVDEFGGKVYWSDYSSNSIKSANLSNGLSITSVIISSDKGVGGPLSIAIKNRRIYWVCDSTGQIRRARLTGLDEKIIYTPLTPTYISGIDVE